MKEYRTGDKVHGGVVTGVSTYARNPAPLDAAVPVTFAEIFAEAQNEAGRYAIHSRDLAARASETDDESLRSELLLCAKSRARMAQVFEAMMRLVDRVRNDAVIMNRLKVLAAEQKVRDAIDALKTETRNEKDKPDDAAASAADTGTDESSDGASATDND